MTRNPGIAILALLFSGAVSAAPAYYTFTGFISTINDSAGAAATANLAVDQPVEYVFLIDTESPGQATLNDGSIVIREDTSDGEIKDYVYTDLVSGTLADPVGGGFFSNDPAAAAEYNFGEQTIPPPPFAGYTLLLGGSADSYVIINNQTLIADWEVEPPLDQGSPGAFVAFEWVYDSDGNRSFIESDLSLTAITPLSQQVEIDIKPGGERNRINLARKRRLIPVAVLGSIDFDATQIDYSSVRFGPAEAAPVHAGRVRDVDGDGFVDMKFHFRTGDSGIECGDTEASLSGETFDGLGIVGTDAIKTVRCE